MTETIYKTSRWRTAMWTLLSVVGIGAAYLLFLYGVTSRSAPWGIIGMITGCVCVVSFGMQTISPTRLLLTDKGFDLHHWTGHEVIAWRDIGPLSVFSRGSTAMIVYTYLPDRLPAKLSPLHRINHWSGRFDGSLPSNLPISNAALSAEMNIRRERVTG